ncbi:DUF262 domain-containing HNH endonuclease family protein [Mesorhizobium sp. M0029]|uniref:DUF262 domain-containing protein n=1 Tax=Mesorhizobium sp. M0029 TaxID=2956850 RepID=UPI0033398226
MATSKYQFENKGIGSLLREGRLTVPPNQRSYAWEDRHVENLLQDINEAITSDDDEYFLGTLVLIEPPKTIPSIADGQQRLATTTILLARIRDRLSQLKREAGARAVDNDFLRNVDMETEELQSRITLNLEDNDYFKERILSGPMDADFDGKARDREAVRPSNKRLARASFVVDEFIDDLLKPIRHENQPATLVRWVKFLENSAAVVVVRVADEIGAYRIFETLNDRGLRASQADILKNYFFSKSGARLGEAQMMWNVITTAIETLGDDENERLVTYIRHYWVTTHGPTKDRELAAQIKDEITGETKTLQFMRDASLAVQDYVALWSSRHAKWADYSASTRQSVETIASHLRVQQIRPLLFAVARNFEPTEAEKAFRLFVSWSVRFLIYGGRGGMLDTQYSLRAQDVGTKRITKARELRDAMKSYVPTDAQFEEAFASARVSRPHLARYYLRAIDKTIKADPQPEFVANEEADQITLEHVLPLNPDNQWMVDEETAQAAQRMLGNMVLLRATQNREAGNASFAEKREVLKQSGYAITNEVADYKKWSMEEIRDRQLKMAKIATRTWSLSFAD